MYRCFGLLIVSTILLLAITVGLVTVWASEVQVSDATQGTVITVMTTVDDTVTNDNCTLREAIIAANTDAVVDGCPAGNGLDTIILPAGVYTLTIAGTDEDAGWTGDLDITAALTISGTGAVIDADHLDRVLHIDSAQTGVSVNIAGVTVRHGSSDRGGGILNLGTLTMEDSDISNNSVLGYAGGIDNSGVLTITHSVVSGNFVLHWGGGGGGIGNSGELTVRHSTIEGNSGSSGGGISNSGIMTISNSLLHGNGGRFGGGVRNSGILVITGSSVFDNGATTGGGVENSGALTVVSSTVISNEAASGGGVYNVDGTLVVTNSTVSGNAAASDGGGMMLLDGTAHLYNVTVADNIADQDSENEGDGGGIRRSAFYSGTVSVHNTIVAGNLDLSPSGNVHADCSSDPAGIVSGGHNLIGVADGCNWTASVGDVVGSIVEPIDPLLAPVGDNGGPTFTHALVANSPAINAGNNGFCPATDQRGYLRWDGICDIGAYEYGALPSGPVYSFYLPIIFRTAFLVSD